jgi:hypothetical protein
MSGQIFISYRREDGSAWAGRLSDCLKTRLPSNEIFMDVDTMDPGVDFVETVEEIVAACDVLIAVIGSRWLTSSNRRGVRRLAILAGNQNAPNLQKRVKGVRKEAAKYPDIKILDAYYHKETPQDAAAKVEQVMQAHPEVTGWAMIGAFSRRYPYAAPFLEPLTHSVGNR